MKKQTAVEWLENQLKERYSFMNSEPLFEQAKAMEKKQIQDAYCDGGRDIQTNVYKGMKEYYNETYGGDK